MPTKTKACCPIWCRWSAAPSTRNTRAQIVQHAGGNDITLRGIHTGHPADDEITLTAHLLMDGDAPARLERLVAELSLLPGVRAVQWYAGDDVQTDDRR